MYTLKILDLNIFLDIKPFYLHLLPEEEAHLCPVRALADWFSVSRITTGYVFRKMASGDRPVEANTPMVSKLNIYLHLNI